MTEERKMAVLFAATILSARKIQEVMLLDKPVLNEQYFIDRAIEKAAFILERIDRKWPTS